MNATMAKRTSASLGTFILILGVNLHAQDFSRLKEIALNNEVDCKKAEPTVLQCSNSLLATVCTENIESLNAISFIIRWMGATPDYQFGLNERLYGAIKSNEILAGRYFAALAKTAMEKGIADKDKLQFESIKLFLDYCENPSYAVKITKRLQKFIDAKNNGTLPDLL